jgi:hypothetical protein
MRSLDEMSGSSKGVTIGLINAAVITSITAVVSDERWVGDAVAAVGTVGVFAGPAFGAVAGHFAAETPHRRSLLFGLITILCALVVLMGESEPRLRLVTACACLTTALGCVVLERWTRRDVKHGKHPQLA